MSKSIEEIAYELQGTCLSLHEVLERNDMDGADNDAEFCARLDELVFCCNDCNWWFEIHEMSDADWICCECEIESE